jgi:hypothetical protein
MHAQLGSCNNTILFETEVIHSLVHYLFNLLPVRATLNELVDVLHSISLWCRIAKNIIPYLRTICATVPSDISDNLSKVFGILNDVDMSQHLEMRKLRSYCRHLKISEKNELGG